MNHRIFYHEIPIEIKKTSRLRNYARQQRKMQIRIKQNKAKQASNRKGVEDIILLPFPFSLKILSLLWISKQCKVTAIQKMHTELQNYKYVGGHHYRKKQTTMKTLAKVHNLDRRVTFNR